MVSMDKWTTKAHEKIKNEQAAVTGQKEKAMASAVCAMLEEFSWQEPEFAQAIVQGGSIRDCMAAVAKGVGSSISDLDAYKKAVRFYFPGAEIRMQMTIDLIGAAAENPELTKKQETAPETDSVIRLDFSDFFGG